MRNHQFQQALHKVIETTVARKALQVQRWKEDHITLSWLEELQDSGVLSNPASGALNIELATWKQSGREEFNTGDVAVFVRIRHPETSHVHAGGAYLEAKRSEPSAPFKYPNFESLQSQRFSSLLAHRYLFYRFRPYDQESAEIDAVQSMLRKFKSQGETDRGRQGRYTRAVEPSQGIRSDNRADLQYTSVVPTYFLRCFPTPLGDGIFSAGVSLASQIHRYCHGWDLGPPLPPDQPVSVPDDVPFILTVAAGHGGAERPSLPEVPDGYVRVRAGEDFRPRGGGMTMG